MSVPMSYTLCIKLEGEIVKNSLYNITPFHHDRNLTSGWLLKLLKLNDVSFSTFLKKIEIIPSLNIRIHCSILYEKSNRIDDHNLEFR